MSLSWTKRRKTGRPTPAFAPAAAPAAEIAKPRGRHARGYAPAWVAVPAPEDRPAAAPGHGWGAGSDLPMRVPGLNGAPGFTIPAGPPRDQPAARPVQGPDLGELTLTDKPLGVLRPETAPERPEPAPDLADAPQDRPYVPQDSGLPSAWLRAVPHSGPGDKVLETLTGLPHHVGTRAGTGLEGICLGAADDIWLVLDTESDEVLGALEDAVRDARANRVPAVKPDPQAAEHVETLERELDAHEAAAEVAADEPEEPIEVARAVLTAAGNLGSLPDALKQADGEAVMDLLYIRAALHHAIKGGDEAAAVKAAGDLIDIVSELCGDETAYALANGEVPVTPEPEAADESEPAADETATQDESEAAA